MSTEIVNLFMSEINVVGKNVSLAVTFFCLFFPLIGGCGVRGLEYLTLITDLIDLAARHNKQKMRGREVEELSHFGITVYWESSKQ